MRVLVCGGRDFNDHQLIKETLDKIDFDVLIHGGARGADHLAGVYCLTYRGESCLRVFPADWELYGKRAGYIRNAQMLEEGKPDLVVAFPGGKGTAMMKRLASEKGVPVVEIT